MCYKTLVRAAYGSIPIDSQKIDEAYLRSKQLEASFAEAAVNLEIEAEANSEVIDITDYSDIPVDPDTGEVVDADNSPASGATSPPVEGEQMSLGTNAPRAESPVKAPGEPF